MTPNSPNSSAACGFWAAGTSTLALGAGLLGAGPPPLAWGLAGAAAVAGAGLAVRRRAVLWAACGLSAAAGFGLLMDVVGLLFAQGVDDGAAAVLHALGLLGAVLLAGAARPRGTGPVVAPQPSAASRRAHLAACAGALAFVPYVAMKLTWALGGTFAGISGAEMLAASERNGASGLWLTLERWGLDGTVLLAALGVFLLFGLVGSWGQVFPRWTLALRGRRVPRWLPLGPALIGVGTLVPYGLFGVGYLTLASAGVVSVRAGDFHSPADAVLVGWIGFSAFAGYGLALLVATRSYWLRTRSVTAGP
ncbi:hypothetical protein OG429_25490 [Streptomyces sp. NBC_00190]|uniref:hypothetical protein n=1 Tax=unclassified Streptomyces TaxID=2593676 RepID=UPI002E292A12|nr:hypothetical protein [Streptomyces sp. NBC_00190]